MLVQLKLDEFAQVLGSDAPAPGGGSVAALSGALGAELVCMVCRLSVGRQEFEAHQALLADTLSHSEKLAKSLMARVDLDTQAFNKVMAAFKLPKATDAEKKARAAAIQEGYKEAVQSPLGIARECFDVLLLAKAAAGKSNTNAISDLGVSALQAYAGLEGALMNVKINIPSIKDEKFNSDTLAETAVLLQDGRKARDHVYELVSASIG